MSWRKCKYSEIRSLHKYNSNKKITLMEEVLLLRGDVPRRCSLRLSIFFRNPYPTNIQTCGSSLIQLVMQMHVFRGNIFPGGWFSARLLFEHNPVKYVRLCNILFICCNVSTKSPQNWSLLFTNLYSSNITMFGFVMVPNFMNSLRIACELLHLIKDIDRKIGVRSEPQFENLKNRSPEE